MKRSKPFSKALIARLEKRLGKDQVPEALSIHPASYRRIKSTNRADSTVVRLANHIAYPKKYPLPAGKSNNQKNEGV